MTDGRQRSSIIVPANGQITIGHALGRIPKGIQILTGNNNAITDSNRTKTTITLNNSATTAATITIWIF